MRRPDFVIGAMVILALAWAAISAVRWQMAQQCPAEPIEIGHMLVAGCRISNR